MNESNVINASGDKSQVITNQKEGQRTVMGDHNGHVYSSDIVDTLKSVINSQQEMIKGYAQQILDISSTMKEMKVVMERHADEGHEYMVKMSEKYRNSDETLNNMEEYIKVNESKWTRVDKFIDANQKQVAMTKKNKTIWENHIKLATEHKEAEIKNSKHITEELEEIKKVVKSIRDNL